MPRCAHCFMIALAVTGCARHRPTTGLDERSCRDLGEAATARFLDQHRARTQGVIARTIGYLGTFSIDPPALQRQGIKGKKKLVELLDAYVSLHRYAKHEQRSMLLARFRQAAAVTTRGDYHDLAGLDDRHFQQDATSYLRACYLMEKMGLDTRAYRQEILKIKARLDAHLSQRGPHQRMAFSFYYEHFKMELPSLLRDQVKDSLIARRVDPYRMTLDETYSLTHEVFVPYDFGAQLAASPFNEAERVYLRRALEIKAVFFLHQRNIDILGEVLACLRYLGQTDLAVYREGIAALLASQRPSGAFGDYESLRARRGPLLELDLYLHTTSVAMDLLPLAFADLPRPDPRRSGR